MIYNYEAEILRHINRCIPEIRLMTYASDEELFNAMSSVKYYPAFFYSRDSVAWEWNKPIPVITDEYKRVSLVPYIQPYKGHILVENQALAFKIASNLRFFLLKNPYIYIEWPTGSNKTVPVQIRVLSVSVSEQRRPDDKKGPCRDVQISWQSQLVMDNNGDAPDVILTDGFALSLSVGNIVSVVRVIGENYERFATSDGEFLLTSEDEEFVVEN